MSDTKNNWQVFCIFVYFSPKFLLSFILNIKSKLYYSITSQFLVLFFALVFWHTNYFQFISKSHIFHHFCLLCFGFQTVEKQTIFFKAIFVNRKFCSFRKNGQNTNFHLVSYKIQPDIIFTSLLFTFPLIINDYLSWPSSLIKSISNHA